MATFAAICKGVEHVREVEITTLDGTKAKCLLRILVGADDAVVLQKAREFAKARGVDNPSEQDPLYQLGFWCNTLLIACVDADSPEGNRRPFFDSVDQMLRHLDRDRISYLFEQWRLWQEQNAARPASMSPEEFIGAVFTIAQKELGDDLPFVHWGLTLQLSFVHTLARAYVDSLPLRSLGGPGSSSNTEGDGAVVQPNPTSAN